MKNENGARINTNLTQNNINVEVELWAGKYTAEYMPTKEYIRKFDFSSTVREVISNNESRSKFNELFPEINANGSIFEHAVNKRLDELIEDSFLKEIVTKEKVLEFLNTLNRVRKSYQQILS